MTNSGGKAAGWNPEAYAAVSVPQQTWARKMIDSLQLRGDEHVGDVGCGTGEVTRLLLERLPQGRVTAMDISEGMLAKARALLGEEYRGRVSFVKAEAESLPFVEEFDCIFSAATFHWVLDHAQLYQSLFTALKRGGRLRSQCAGKGNLSRVRELAPALMHSTEFEAYFLDWQNTWKYASAEEDAANSAAAGFTEVKAWIEHEPTRFESREAFEAYMRHVVCRDYLSHLPTPELQQRFLDLVSDAAAQWPEPFTLDYVRLNVEAERAR